jgi:hypothetical protein
MSVIRSSFKKAVVAFSCFFLSSATDALANCMPTTSISYIGTGFNLSVGGFYAEFAISHSWLNGTSLVSLGTGALCRLAPEPWASLCNATIALNLFWIKSEDSGNGVFVMLDQFGIWVPSGATSTCVSSSSGGGFVPQCQNLTCRNGGTTETVCLTAGSVCPSNSTSSSSNSGSSGSKNSVACPVGQIATQCGDPPIAWCNVPPGGCPTCGPGETLVRGRCVSGLAK